MEVRVEGTGEGRLAGDARKREGEKEPLVKSEAEYPTRQDDHKGVCRA
jgi:hypothetical protein